MLHEPPKSKPHRLLFPAVLLFLGAGRPIVDGLKEDDMPGTRKSVKELFTQLRKDVFGEWLDFAGFLRDRRLIVSDIGVILDRPRKLTNRPLPFALHALLIPTVLLGAISGVASFLLHAPSSPEEREVEQAVRIQQQLADSGSILSTVGAKSPTASTPYDAMSTDELEVLRKRNVAWIEKMEKRKSWTVEEKAENARIRDESIAIAVSLMERTVPSLQDALPQAIHLTHEREAALKALIRVNETKREWLPAVASVALVLNSLLFAWLLRRKFPQEKWVRDAHVVHLYSVAAALSPVLVLATVLTIALDYAGRYDAWWFPAVYTVLSAVLTTWAIFALRSVAKRMASLNSAQAVRYAFRAIAVRLFLSNIVSQLLIVMVTGLIFSAFLRLLYRQALS
jgi:hypothetical protein